MHSISFLFKAPPSSNLFGDILQPQGSSTTGANDLFGGFGPGAATNGTSSGSQANNKKGLVTGDLDASLANLTTNLNLAAGQGK